MTLASRWPLPDHPGLRDRLLAAYGGEERGYHDRRHLVEVLQRLDELAAAGTAFDRLAVELAAWFHDAVYDGAPEPEERSAQWAQDALSHAGLPAAVVAEVARLVRSTEHHRPAAEDADGCALSDADLAILAAPAGRYAEYVADVRREHPGLADAEFAAGRAAVLELLLAKPRLFHTPHAVARWEERARRNVEDELRGLSAGPRLTGGTG